MRWTPELNKCVMRCYFTAAKGADPVKNSLFLLGYPHLTVRVSEQRIEDEKRRILVQNLLSEIKMEMIIMLKNHPPAEVVEPLEKDTNKEIVEAVIEDIGAGDKPSCK